MSLFVLRCTFPLGAATQPSCSCSWKPEVRGGLGRGDQGGTLSPGHCPVLPLAGTPGLLLVCTQASPPVPWGHWMGRHLGPACLIDPVGLPCSRSPGQGPHGPFRYLLGLREKETLPRPPNSDSALFGEVAVQSTCCHRSYSSREELGLGEVAGRRSVGLGRWWNGRRPAESWSPRGQDRLRHLNRPRGSPAVPTPGLGSGPSLPAWAGDGTVASPSPLLSHL